MIYFDISLLLNLYVVRYQKWHNYYSYNICTFTFAMFQVMNTHNATIKFLVLSHWRFSKVLRAG